MVNIPIGGHYFYITSFDYFPLFCQLFSLNLVSYISHTYFRMQSSFSFHLTLTFIRHPLYIFPTRDLFFITSFINRYLFLYVKYCNLSRKMSLSMLCEYVIEKWKQNLSLGMLTKLCEEKYRYFCPCCIFISCVIKVIMLFSWYVIIIIIIYCWF